jgi:hypothetical protein
MVPVLRCLLVAHTQCLIARPMHKTHHQPAVATDLLYTVLWPTQWVKDQHVDMVVTWQ